MPSWSSTEGRATSLYPKQSTNNCASRCSLNSRGTGLDHQGRIDVKIEGTQEHEQDSLQPASTHVSESIRRNRCDLLHNGKPPPDAGSRAGAERGYGREHRRDRGNSLRQRFGEAFGSRKTISAPDFCHREVVRIPKLVGIRPPPLLTTIQSSVPDYDWFSCFQAASMSAKPIQRLLETALTRVRERNCPPYLSMVHPRERPYPAMPFGSV